MTNQAAANTLEAKLNKLKKTIKQHADNQKSSEEQEPQGTDGVLIQLPVWGENRRGLPNDLGRSALFTVRHKRIKRAHLTGTLITSIGDVEIKYTGEELRQDDEDCWLHLLHLARLQPLGTTVTFSARSMLLALGWGTDKSAYDRLHRCIDRLSSNTVHITQITKEKKRNFSGSLIRSFEWEEKNNNRYNWCITFEPRIMSLFGHVCYSQLAWEQRKQLGSLAKWLHSYYVTHRNPYPIKVASIRELCGSSTKALYKFRQALGQALNELKKVQFLKEWKIDKKDLVHVKRVLTSSIK
jgi:hypothetical protein